ncbi:MAG: ATP-binding protein [Deltaproteobacteria bacterium]|nr:ATP-binding protein [Deltaproteobacteria bacterium]
MKRLLKIDATRHQAFFLWGPRKTGKTTLLRAQFPDARWYDLLNTDLKTRLLLHPEQLRHEVREHRPPLVIIDEVQKVPALLDEVHWCIENTATRFILSGSSPRKLKRGAANLLGGRAIRVELFPLTTVEIAQPDLLQIFHHGLLPQHYLAQEPEALLHSYVVDYLNEEIQAEALTRNIPAFARFLDAVAVSHGELINYANIARDCGVASKTVREYYQILEDTLMGYRLEPWRRKKKRRLIETAKFYLFDVGVVRALKQMIRIQPRTEEFGRAFEQFILGELRAYLSYRDSYLPMSFWRTSTGLEVDCIVGPMTCAIECKGTTEVKVEHLKGLRGLLEEHHPKHALLVCCEATPRRIEQITILPWQEFCRRLWAGELV